MIEEYKEELKKLKEKMILAENFSEKLPEFRDYIIRHKLTGNERPLYLGDKYKELYLAWGIRRHLYKAGSNNITNYSVTLDKDVYLYNLYINPLSMFDRHEFFGLEEVISKTEMFFFDNLNTTIYVEERQLIDVLEKLNDWYTKAKEQNKILFNKEKLDKAKKEVERLSSI